MISKLLVKNEVLALKQEIKILKKASYLTLLKRIKEIVDFMVNSPILKILFEPYIVENDKRVLKFLESSINSGDLYYKTYKNETDKNISEIDEDIKFVLSLLFEIAHRDERFDLEKLKKYENSEEGHKNANIFIEIINTAFERIEYKLDILISELNEIKEKQINEKQITLINNGVNNGIMIAGNGNSNSIDLQFDNIKEKIEDNVKDENKKAEIINILNEMKSCIKSKNNNSFYELYTKFVSKIADYITIVPYILSILKMFMP